MGPTSSASSLNKAFNLIISTIHSMVCDLVGILLESQKYSWAVFATIPFKLSVEYTAIIKSNLWVISTVIVGLE